MHPAAKEDPTQPGMLGTEALRGSKDAFNQQLTFSVVSRDMSSAQGYSTLDLECDHEDTYCILLQGFRTLLELAEQHKKSKDTTEDEDAGLFSRMKRRGGKERSKGHKRSHRKRARKKLDPISQLFEPSDNLDPLRALQVGGGLLPTGRGVKSMVLSSGATIRTVLSPSRPIASSAKSDAQPLPPAQFLGQERN